MLRHQDFILGSNRELLNNSKQRRIITRFAFSKGVATLWKTRGRYIRDLLQWSKKEIWETNSGHMVYRIKEMNKLERDLQARRMQILRQIQHERRARGKIQEWFPESYLTDLIGIMCGAWNAGRTVLLEGGALCLGTPVKKGRRRWSTV